MRIRIVPQSVFGLIQGLVIISLIYSPAPLIGGIGGYSQETMILSITLGILLSSVSFLSAFRRLVKFRSYLTLSIAVGLGLLLYAFLRLPQGSAPFIIFVCYGIALAGSSTLVERPRQELRRSIPRSVHQDKIDRRAA